MVFCQATVIFSQTRADDILGYYIAFDPKTNEKGQMEIYRAADGTYEAKCVWVENKNNIDQVGTIQVRNLTYNPKTKEWKNGKVMYDGSEYSMTISINGDGRLKIRGYLGITLFGKTLYWLKEKELRNML